MPSLLRLRNQSFRNFYASRVSHRVTGTAPEIDLGFEEYDPLVEGPNAGETIGGFVVVENFGGGEAAVLRVLRIHDKVEFALRIPMDQSPLSRDRNQSIQLKTSAINDGSIPRCFGFVDSVYGFGILSEFVYGEDVCRYADRRFLSIRDRLRLFNRFCSSAAQLHRRRLVHCDIKPSNAIVRESGRVCLLDLGGLTAVGEQVAEDHPGTNGYRAPERTGGEWDVRASVDAFSLGVILYQLLVGTLPSNSRNELLEALNERTERLNDRCILRRRTVSALRRRLGTAIAKVIEQAMESDPTKRTSDADGLKKAARSCI